VWTVYEKLDDEGRTVWALYHQGELVYRTIDLYDAVAEFKERSSPTVALVVAPRRASSRSEQHE
jgi:hypothetical protein